MRRRFSGPEQEALLLQCIHRRTERPSEFTDCRGGWAVGVVVAGVVGAVGAPKAVVLHARMPGFALAVACARMRGRCGCCKRPCARGEPATSPHRYAGPFKSALQIASLCHSSCRPMAVAAAARSQGARCKQVKDDIYDVHCIQCVHLKGTNQQFWTTDVATR